MSHDCPDHATERGTSSLVAIELKRHMPFTALGALTGIAIMAAFVAAKVSHETSELFFEIAHPVHILLSTIVTTALFRRYRQSWLAAVAVGGLGSVVLCVLSDILLPYAGAVLLGAHVHFHLCLLEKEWWLVVLGAVVGVAIGLWRPGTRLPHAGHVFVSTWASLFYLTAHGQTQWLPLLPAVFLLLFVAVWVPCCFSDILFPLLVAGKRAALEHHH